MQYFIGIVPKKSFKDKIIHIQRKWSTNVLPDIVEPHITVKAQGGLTQDEKWLENIIQVCRSFQPFNISIGKPKYFGEEILYLSVESEKLIELHEKIVNVISPPEELIQRYFELDNFVPHMTLAKTYYGLSKQDLSDMAATAEHELNPYPALNVDFIRVYKETTDQRGYEKYVDVPLSSDK